MSTYSQTPLGKQRSKKVGPVFGENNPSTDPEITEIMKLVDKNQVLKMF